MTERYAFRRRFTVDLNFLYDSQASSSRSFSSAERSRYSFSLAGSPESRRIQAQHVSAR